MRIDRCGGCGELIDIASDHKPECPMRINVPPVDAKLAIPSESMTAQEEIAELERKYHERFLNDPVFHAQSRALGNLLFHLQGEDGDSLHSGFVLAAFLTEHFGINKQLAEAWNRGMADAKLQALGIRSSVRNPYLED